MASPILPYINGIITSRKIQPSVDNDSVCKVKITAAAVIFLYIIHMYNIWFLR